MALGECPIVCVRVPGDKDGDKIHLSAKVEGGSHEAQGKEIAGCGTKREWVTSSLREAERL